MKKKSMSKENAMGKKSSKEATKIVHKDDKKSLRDVKKTKKLLDPLTRK